MKTTQELTAADALALLSRRAALRYGLSALAVAASLGKLRAESLTKPASDIAIENFAANGKSLGAIKTTKLVKSDAEWRKQLAFEAYSVARHSGTEAPYSGKYWDNHAAGLYRCICCDTALFNAKTKFESGTGWPSFWQAISSMNVVKSDDRSFGMQRDAISCHRCDAHLGHVFDDGPKPSGLRYCMNSVALSFAPYA